jgi:hypothetical protein
MKELLVAIGYEAVVLKILPEAWSSWGFEGRIIAQAVSCWITSVETRIQLHTVALGQFYV